MSVSSRSPEQPSARAAEGAAAHAAATRTAEAPGSRYRRDRDAVTALHEDHRAVMASGSGWSSRPLRACAYCGEAHQQRWTIPDGSPPEVVELPVGTGTRSYRLVRHPRTGRPARDAHGALVFIPVRAADTSW